MAAGALYFQTHLKNNISGKKMWIGYLVLISIAFDDFISFSVYSSVLVSIEKITTLVIEVHHISTHWSDLVKNII